MVSSIINAVIGSNAAKKASSQAQAGYAAATGAETSQTQAANKAETDQYGTIRSDLLANQANNQANYQPYLNTGTAANNQLGYALGLGGTGTGEAGSLAHSFGASDFQEDPGYQFALQQGQAALDRVSASKGKYFSGGAIKDLTNYNQGMANQQYQNAYDRYNTNQSNLYSRLSGVAGTGLNAASGLATSNANTQHELNSAGQNSANHISANDIELGGQIGGNDTGAAGARVAGTLNSAGAWQNGIQQTQNDALKAAGAAATGGASMFGTAAGTPMSGGQQGPTQGSGLYGYVTGLN